MTLDIAVQRMADELLRVPPFDLLSLDHRVALAAHIRLGVYEALDVLPHEEVRDVVYVLTRGGVLMRSEPKQEEVLQAAGTVAPRAAHERNPALGGDFH